MQDILLNQRIDNYLETNLMWKYLNKVLKKEENPFYFQNLLNIHTAILYAAEHIETIRDVLPKYTVHGVQHSCNVLDIMGKLLVDMKIISDNFPEDTKSGISSYEIALLILSAFYHDIGMCVSETLPIREEVWYDRYVSSKINRSASDIEKEYIRDCHHIRSEIFINEFIKTHSDFHWTEKNGNLKYFSELGDVCKSHNEGQSYLKNMNSIYGQDAKFCAIVLRLADILDLDNTRAPRSELSKVYFEETSEDIYSWYEWKKHWDSSGVVFDDNNVLRLTGSTADPVVYQKLELMVKWIKQELDQCRDVLTNTSKRFRDTHLPQMIVNDIKPIRFIAEPLSYEIDQKDAIKLFMGENLYLDKMVFVRELLQNAIDASLYFQRVNKKLLIEKGIVPINFELPPSTVDIRVWRPENRIIDFFIEDNGTGMNQEMISNYFLKIGKSFYTSDEVIQDGVDFTPISRFGIGFLSAFLVTSKITVVTRHYKNEAVLLHLTIDLNQNSYVLRKNDFSHNRFDIQEEIVDWNGTKTNWDKIFKYKKNGTCIFFEIEDPNLEFDDTAFEQSIYKFFLPTNVNVNCNFFGKVLHIEELPGSYISDFEYPLNLQEVCTALHRQKKYFSDDDKIVFVSLPIHLYHKHNNDLIQGELCLLSIYDTSERPNTYSFSYQSDYNSYSINLDIGGYLESITNISFSQVYEYYRTNSGINIYFNGINHLYSFQENDNICPEYWKGFIMLEGRYRPIVDIARSGKGSLDIETIISIYYLLFEQLNKFAGDEQAKRQMVCLINLPSVLKAKLIPKEIYLVNELISQKNFNWNDIIYIKTSLGALTVNEIHKVLSQTPSIEILLLEKVKVKDRYTVLEYLKRKLIAENFGINLFFHDGAPKIKLSVSEDDIHKEGIFPQMYFVNYDEIELLKYNNYPINKNHWFAKWCIDNLQNENIGKIIRLLSMDFFVPNTKSLVVNEINKILTESTDYRLSIKDFVIGERNADNIWEWMNDVT